jgi:uncharacterized alpha-E superfamily protein
VISRVADHCFWFGRYVERAEATSRMLAATASLPKQVLWGDRDPFIPSTTADRYGTDQVTHFADYGHWVMVEDPDASAAAIAALVARASG